MTLFKQGLNLMKNMISNRGTLRQIQKLGVKFPQELI
jgi:hypothetical protein